MSKFSIKRYCVVCGAELPTKSKEHLLGDGYGIKQPDGSVIWCCRFSRHTDQQISESLHTVPEFMTAHKKK